MGKDTFYTEISNKVIQAHKRRDFTVSQLTQNSTQNCKQMLSTCIHMLIPIFKEMFVLFKAAFNYQLLSAND